MNPFTRFAVRDLTLLATTLTLWAVLPQTTWLGWMVGGLSIACAFAFHEWGHLAGAKLSGASVYAPKTLWSPFLYNFDAQANSRSQFLVTSITGFAATGIFLLLFFFVLPAVAAATAPAPAIPITQNGALVLAGLTVIFEFPIAIAVALGKATPDLRLFTDRRESDQARS